MNRNLMIHGAWLLAAISSFVLGSRMFPVEVESRNSASESDLRSKGRPGSKAGQSRTAIRSEGSPGARRGGGSSVLNGLKKVAPLSEEDIARLGDEFRKASSPIGRRLAFSKLLEGLTAENALQVREQIAHMSDRSAEFREFHYAWGAVGGNDAIMFGVDTKEDDMSPALAGWASADPGAARAWFESFDPENDPRFDPLVKDRELSGEDLRNHLMGGLVHGLADGDPDAAVEFIQASGDDRTAGYMHVVAEAVMRTGSPSEAAQWAEALPEGAIRGEAMERVADRLVDVDPAAAAAWAENFSAQPEGAGVIGEVGANWAWRDPQAALSWLQTLPEGESQSAGMARAFEAWAHRDPTAASEHLAEMPPSTTTDAAVSGFSRRLAWEDPQAAITWAETISSDAERRTALVDVGRVWIRRDPNGAAEWVGSSGLPEEVQASILNPGGQTDRE